MRVADAPGGAYFSQLTCRLSMALANLDSGVDNSSNSSNNFINSCFCSSGSREKIRSLAVSSRTFWIFNPSASFSFLPCPDRCVWRKYFSPCLFPGRNRAVASGVHPWFSFILFILSVLYPVFSYYPVTFCKNQQTAGSVTSEHRVVTKMPPMA